MDNSYNAILVIINQLTKMVYYKAVKTTIDALELVEVIINIVVRYHDIPESIICDSSSLFVLKF